MRQLWVAGQRAQRTLMSDVNATLGGLSLWAENNGTSLGFTSGTPLPPSWAVNSTTAIEFVWPIVIRNWVAPRCTLAAINGPNNFTLASPCSAFLALRSKANNNRPVPPPVLAEATPTFPLPPGTFYHDLGGGRLFYALAQGQTSVDLESQAFAPASEALLAYTGVSGHVWQNITFEYATERSPNSPGGFVEVQAAVAMCAPRGSPGCDGSIAATPPPYGAVDPIGNVRVWGGAGMAFESCVFARLGGVFGLSIMGGAAGPRVEECSFDDLSGGGLKVGSVSSGGGVCGTPPLGWDAGAYIAGNTVTRAALEFAGAPAIMGGYLAHATLTENTVDGAGYSGFSVGWGWNAPTCTGFGNVTLARNAVLHTMRTLRDGGGIYVNGKTNPTLPPSRMTGNYILADEAVYAALYLDASSSNWVVADNVVDASPLAWAAFLQGCCGTPAENATVERLWYRDTLAPNNNCATIPGANCQFDNATIYNVSGAWPAPAQMIIDAAGAAPPQTPRKLL